MTAVQGPVGKASASLGPWQAWGGTSRGSDLQQVASGWDGNKSLHHFCSREDIQWAKYSPPVFLTFEEATKEGRTWRPREAHRWERNHSVHFKEAETPDPFSLCSLVIETLSFSWCSTVRSRDCISQLPWQLGTTM